MKIIIYSRGGIEKIIPAHQILEVVHVKVATHEEDLKYYFRTWNPERYPIREKDYIALLNFLPSKDTHLEIKW